MAVRAEWGKEGNILGAACADWHVKKKGQKGDFQEERKSRRG